MCSLRILTLGLFLTALLQAADEPIIPSTLAREQQESLKKFLKAHETPERFVPAGAKYGDEPPAAELEAIKATKENPIKQYTVQITPHRPVPGAETIGKADVYYYRPNPEKGKPGITVKHTVDLTTGEQLGVTEVLTKAHTPVSRDEINEGVELAKDLPILKTLYAGRDAKDVRYEYLQMKINSKSATAEPGDRVIRLVFSANANEGEAKPTPVAVLVNFTKGTVILDNR